MKHLLKVCVLIIAVSTYAGAQYNTKQLSKLAGMPEELVTGWMRYFQMDQDAHEQTASYYGVFSRIINMYHFKRGCEVGVAYGGHACDILQKTDIEILYCIDPYAAHLYPNLAPYGAHNLYFFRVKSRLSPFADRVQLIRDYSLSAAQKFPDNSLDFVFIDAGHDYESVKADIATWYQKVRVGGVIGGDDYATQWPGVPQAVNEFAAAYNLTLHIDEAEPRIWWIIKPEDRSAVYNNKLNNKKA